jgi:signal transduction histidine kinase
MILRTLLFILYFHCCASLVHAQQRTILDSLLNTLKSVKEGEEKVLLLFRIGQELEHSDLEKAKEYYREARVLGNRMDYALTEIKFISNYTFVLNMQAAFDSSLFWNLKGIEEAKKLGRSEDLAKAYFNTGTSFQYLFDYENAVENYQKGLELFDEMGNKAFSAQANDILQVLYTSLRQYEKAKTYGKNAVVEFRKLDQPKMLAYSLTNLGVIYGTTAQYDSAVLYYTEALKIAEKIGDEVLMATIDLNLADIYLWQNRMVESKLLYESALTLSRKNKLPDSESRALRGFSYHSMFAGEFQQSLQFVKQALAVSINHQIQSENILNLDQLASLAYLQQDPGKARSYELESGRLRDSLLNEQILKNTINTEKRFELNKKNSLLLVQEAELRQKRIMNILLISGILGITLVSLVGYRYFRIRKKMQEQKIRELETEKQLMATQSLLKGQEEERSRIAKDLHDGLGGLLSGVKLQLGAMKGNLILSEQDGMTFNRVLNNLEESISEMRRVAHNMMPETLLKFGLPQALEDYCDGLSQHQQFSIQCDFRGMEERLDHSTELVLYRIIQELINNAVKHSGATTIFVQVIRHDKEQLNLTVEDNGKGFETNREYTNTAGLRNIISRVKFLNGKMDIQSEPGKGTSVYIECEI